MEKHVFPREVTAGLPRITITGQEQVLVEQHGGLSSLQPEEIVLKSSGGSLRITGESLRFGAYSAAEALIMGKIHQVTLQAGSGET